jgi:hypothetical protein
VVALILAVAAVAAAPTLVGAFYTSVGYVHLNRAQVTQDGRSLAEYAAAERAFVRASEWAPRAERWRIGLGIVKLHANDAARALELLREASVGDEHDPVLQGHLLNAAARASDHQTLMATYERISVPELRREYRDAAAASAVALALDVPTDAGERFHQSLQIWPDNLCALAARSARGDETALAALRTSAFDGSYSEDATYTSCLQKWTEQVVTAHSELADTLAQDGASMPTMRSETAVSAAATADTVAFLAEQSLDRPLTPAWTLRGFRMADAAGSEQRTVWLRVTPTAPNDQPPANAIRSGDGWIVTVRAANRLRNGGFELGTGIGPYVPWAFERVGTQVPGFHVVRSGASKAIEFELSASAAELRQQVRNLTPGHLLLFALSVRADRASNTDYGVSLYTYWTTEIGSPNGYSRVVSGRSAFPDWRSLALLADVPPFSTSGDVSFASNLTTGKAQLDDVFLADLTSEFVRAAQ